MLGKVKRVHFVGIGGSGMAPLAQVLLEAGFEVQGSDLRPSATTDKLRGAGARIFAGHRAEHVEGAELLVISAAVPADNAEVRRARELEIPIMKRAAVWGELTRQQRTIAVAGTHGKTTTSAMIASLLTHAGLQPSFMVGGELIGQETGARLGAGSYLVVEADEFDRSFLNFSPWAAVLTNIEADHLDYYGSLAAIVEAFQQFVELVESAGAAVLCWDDPCVRGLQVPEGVALVKYGFHEDAEWRATGLTPNSIGGNDFVLKRNDVQIGTFSLAVPGRHNVANATAALAIAGWLEIAWPIARDALIRFRGTHRRLELKGEVNRVRVYDDYAHHPTEVRATLQAIRERHQGRVIVVFQPHTYHRTRELLPEFATAFAGADLVAITDIYLPPGREVDTLGISAPDLVAAMDHPGARYVGPLAEAVSWLEREVTPGDVVLVMGAGDICLIAQQLLGKLGR